MIRKKKRWYIPLVLIAAVSLIAALVLAVKAYSVSQQTPTDHPQSLYDYSDMTAGIPASISPGMRLDVDWQGYPAPQLYRYTSPPNAKLRIDLSVELVPQGVFQRVWPNCGTFTQSWVLDTIHTSNWQGATLYQRRIQIPQNLGPGVYELVRLVRSTVRTGCTSTKVVLAP